MSVESEILRIQRNIADTYAAVASKGGEVPTQPNSANLAAAVQSIPAGGDNSALVKAPVGTIVIWSGTAGNIPAGWQLCDGTNGTPDLRDKFVLGAGPSHAVGETGGEEEVTLTTAQMPKHSHIFGIRMSAQLGKDKVPPSSDTTTGTGISYGSTGTTGGSNPHPNMPPYYTLCYIMKLTADSTDGVVSLNGQTGEITLSEGDNITITKSGSTITISATGGGSSLQSITITNPPDKVNYSVGDVFDPTGMTATANFSDGSDLPVTADSLTFTPSGPLSVDNTAITVSFEFGGKTATAEQPITVSAVRIYGASWDGTSTTKWSRTDDAALFVDPVPYVNGAANYSSPFDGRQPWSGMQKVNRTGGVMVAIPKFWYKLTQNGAGMKIQIADGAAEGFSVSPAHMDKGDGKGERDIVYIGRYHCASDYKSKTGVVPGANFTRATARSEIHKLGANIWQSDFAMRFTIWLLYIVEFADWNSQATIGAGCGNNSSAQNMGYTDSMPYHTGTTQSNRSTYGLGTQYRYIEGLWDNVYDWCDGCYNASNGLNIILNPNNFSDSNGGTTVGTPPNGWPSAFSVKTSAGFPMFIPTAAAGSETTYSCDSWYFSASSPAVFVGGGYSQGGNHGLFYVYRSSVSHAGGGIGSRLQELP